jgi:predicted nicotinamide N-methyase
MDGETDGRVMSSPSSSSSSSSSSSIASEGDWVEAVVSSERAWTLVETVAAAVASENADDEDADAVGLSENARRARRRARWFRAKKAADELAGLMASDGGAMEAGELERALEKARAAAETLGETETREAIDRALEACVRARKGIERVKERDFDGVSVRVIETGLGNGVGARLWGAALTLSRLVRDGPDLVRGRDVLELGSGVGLCGLLAAKMGAKTVALSDFEEPLLDALDRGVAENDVGHCSVVVRALDWTKEAALEDTPTPNPAHAMPPDARFDVLLGSDVLYEPQHVAALPACVARRMRPTGECVLVNATRYETMFDDLVAACERAGLKVDRIDIGDVGRRQSWHDGAERALRLRFASSET